MRPFTSTIPLAKALATVLESAVPLTRSELIRLQDAGGRVTSRDVVAVMDVPPFCTAQGDRAELAGVNSIGLARHGSKRHRVWCRFRKAAVKRRSRRWAPSLRPVTWSPP